MMGDKGHWFECQYTWSSPRAAGEAIEEAEHVLLARGARVRKVRSRIEFQHGSNLVLRMWGAMGGYGRERVPLSGELIVTAVDSGTNLHLRLQSRERGPWLFTLHATMASAYEEAFTLMSEALQEATSQVARDDSRPPRGDQVDDAI